VHDELVLDVPQDVVKGTASLVKRVMETAVVLSVPLEVTVKAGLNWVQMAAV
jgi:DNA polymerase-1